MAMILDRVGFAGREATEVREAARQQRFNSGILELRKRGGEGKIYIGQESGFSGYTLAYIKDKFFGLIRLKRFEEGDERAAALTSLREQIHELPVTDPGLKEKYLRSLDFKLKHGLPLRASFYSKAIKELFTTIDQNERSASGGAAIFAPPGYGSGMPEGQQETDRQTIPCYEDVIPAGQRGHVNTDADADIQIHPVPYDYDQNRVVHDDDQDFQQDDGERHLFVSRDAVPLASDGEAPAYDEATGHVQQSARIQEKMYREIKTHKRWKGIASLHRPPARSGTQGNRSGIFEEHASRFDQITGNAEDFYGHYLEPALQTAGCLPQFDSGDARKNFAEECRCLHKNNYLNMVAQKLQTPGELHSTLGYAGIREFLETDVCSAALAEARGSSSADAVSSLRQRVFQTQMTEARGAAGNLEEENRAIAERLRQKFGLAGNQEAYRQACGLAAASNAYILMIRSQQTSVNSRWFSTNPPKIENFSRAVEEAIKFSEQANTANARVMNEGDLEMKIFKLLCDQSWENYSGPEHGLRFMNEPLSEITVDTALRLVWKECSCLGRRDIGDPNRPMANYLNLFGVKETRDYPPALFNLFRSALVEKVRDVSKENKSYELECLLQAGNLYKEIKTEVAGLSLCDVKAEFPVQFKGAGQGDFMRDLYHPLCAAIGENPLLLMFPDGTEVRQNEYIEDLSEKMQSLAAHAMSVAAKDQGVIDNVQDLPVVLREALEQELAKVILRDLGRSDQAEDGAYLKEVCDQAFATTRQAPIQRVADRNEQQRLIALQEFGIGENPDGNKEALLYLQHLSKAVIRNEMNNRGQVVNEGILSDLDILRLEGSEGFIENMINCWTAKKTALGETVTAKKLEMQILTRITDLSWWQYRHGLVDRGENDDLGSEPIHAYNRDDALQDVAMSYRNLAKDGSDAVWARGAGSFFSYSVDGNPFANHQTTYEKLRFGSANKIRKAWRTEMGIQPGEDDFPPQLWGPDENLEFLLTGRVALRNLLDENLAAQAEAN